ncbi:haloacid dehalogenase [Infundibulicybe gibba]|nr:haloacid dehalogenase [Infundibulicybe gibba]
MANNLQDVDALLFDVFGTVVDWQSSIAKALARAGDAHGIVGADWGEFAREWRAGYSRETQRIAAGGLGSLNVDTMHAELLDQMLNSPRWAHLASRWGSSVRCNLVQAWHELDGWEDSTDGLYTLKQQKIIATLSNGNVRLLVDMAKYADLPWDTIFSTQLFGVYKPNPKAYLDAAQHLSLPPSRCALVAAHIYDLRGAAAVGMKTIYVRRPTEDAAFRDGVKAKVDGGEVDVVCDSLLELAQVLGSGATIPQARL